MSIGRRSCPGGSAPATGGRERRETRFLFAEFDFTTLDSIDVQRASILSAVAYTLLDLPSL